MASYQDLSSLPSFLPYQASTRGKSSLIINKAKKRHNKLAAHQPTAGQWGPTCVAERITRLNSDTLIRETWNVLWLACKGYHAWPKGRDFYLFPFVTLSGFICPLDTSENTAWARKGRVRLCRWVYYGRLAIFAAENAAVTNKSLFSLLYFPVAAHWFELLIQGFVKKAGNQGVMDFFQSSAEATVWSSSGNSLQYLEGTSQYVRRTAWRLLLYAIISFCIFA